MANFINHPLKQFCPKGHDKDIVGKADNGQCLLCKKDYMNDYWERYYQENRSEVLIKNNKYIKEHKDEVKIKAKEWRIEHKEEIATHMKQYNREHAEEIRIKKKQYYIDNKERILERSVDYYGEHRKEVLERTKQYAENHPEIYRLADIRNHKKRRLRIPKWGQEGIYKFYETSLEDKLVDHIIPLCGKKISGLHVRWNLQYLTSEDNYKKLNKCNLLEASEWYGKILEEAGLK